MRAPRPISPIPARFVSLPSFEGSGRQNARPPPSLSAASLYYYPRITTIPSDRTPVFITTSTQPRPSPLFSFLFFFAARVCRTTFDEPPLRLHRCLLARLSSSMFYGFSFFFFLFVSSRFSRFIVVYLAIRFFLDHLKRTFEEVAQIFFTWNVIDYVLTIYFFFLFLLALRSCYFRWIYCDLVFKYDF